MSTSPTAFQASFGDVFSGVEYQVIISDSSKIWSGTLLSKSLSPTRRRSVKIPQFSQPFLRIFETQYTPILYIFLSRNPVGLTDTMLEILLHFSDLCQGSGKLRTGSLPLILPTLVIHSHSMLPTNQCQLPKLYCRCFTLFAPQNLLVGWRISPLGFGANKVFWCENWGFQHPKPNKNLQDLIVCKLFF